MNDFPNFRQISCSQKHDEVTWLARVRWKHRLSIDYLVHPKDVKCWHCGRTAVRTEMIGAI